MEYYLFMDQGGHGCDYTIGCGQKVVRLEAESKEAALQESLEKIDDHGDDVDSAILFESGTSIDIHSIRQKREEERMLAEKRAAEKKEKAEYERLKAKFGS